MRWTKARMLMAVALMGSALAAWFAPAPSDTGVVLSPQAQRISRAQASRGIGERVLEGKGEDVLEIQDRHDDEEDFVLFGVKQPAVPAPPPPVRSPPQVLFYGPPLPPPPPPLPFRVLGRYTDGAAEAVFLQYQDKNLVVRVGDTVAGQYTVEALEGNILKLRYIPLDQVQMMDVGGVN